MHTVLYYVVMACTQCKSSASENLYLLNGTTQMPLLYPQNYKKFISVLIGRGIVQDEMCCPFFAICISLYCCGQTLTDVKSDIIDIPDP